LIEPFNAFYSQSLLPKIEASIKAGKRQINLLLKDSKVIYINEEKAREFSPDWDMFTNINTIKDYQTLTERLQIRQKRYHILRR
jgi:molybdopterin-guanine dinucleotide biosynthesis protein A